MNRLARIVGALHRRRRPRKVRYQYQTCDTPLEHAFKIEYQTGILTLFDVTPETFKDRLSRAMGEAIRFTGRQILHQITP